MSLVFELRDVTNRSGLAPLDHVTLGAELIVNSKLALRCGWALGYPSIGIGFRQFGSEMSLAWYSNEFGTVSSRQRDMVYAFHYQVRSF